jgi:hypothetical protein
VAGAGCQRPERRPVRRLSLAAVRHDSASEVQGCGTKARRATLDGDSLRGKDLVRQGTRLGLLVLWESKMRGRDDEMPPMRVWPSSSGVLLVIVGRCRLGRWDRPRASGHALVHRHRARPVFLHRCFEYVRCVFTDGRRRGSALLRHRERRKDDSVRVSSRWGHLLDGQLRKLFLRTEQWRGDVDPELSQAERRALLPGAHVGRVLVLALRLYPESDRSRSVQPREFRPHVPCDCDGCDHVPVRPSGLCHRQRQWGDEKLMCTLRISCRA